MRFVDFEPWKAYFICDYNHFDMENLNSVRSLVEENYMASADLHDAYFTVNVRPEFRNIFVLFERWTLRIASLMSLLQLLESLPSFLKN